MFCRCCLSFCTFSFGHCVVCSSSIYRFWLPPFSIFKLFFYIETAIKILWWSCDVYLIYNIVVLASTYKTFSLFNINSIIHNMTTFVSRRLNILCIKVKIRTQCFCNYAAHLILCEGWYFAHTWKTLIWQSFYQEGSFESIKLV